MWSWNQLLKFNGLKFSSGGTFKLCACDSSLVNGNICRSEADYKIEVELMIFHNTSFSSYGVYLRLVRSTCLA